MYQRIATFHIDARATKQNGAITYPFTLAAYLFATHFEPNTFVDNNAVLLWLLVVSVKLKVHDFLT